MCVSIGTVTYLIKYVGGIKGHYTNEHNIFPSIIYAANITYFLTQLAIWRGPIPNAVGAYKHTFANQQESDIAYPFDTALLFASVGRSRHTGSNQNNDYNKPFQFFPIV